MYKEDTLFWRDADAIEAALSERDALTEKLHALETRFDLELDAYAKDSDLYAARERVTALEKALAKRERTIAARDRRIARLVDALDYARAQGVRFPADDGPQVVLSEEAAHGDESELAETVHGEIVRVFKTPNAMKEPVAQWHPGVMRALSEKTTQTSDTKGLSAVLREWAGNDEARPKLWYQALSMACAIADLLDGSK